MASIVETANNIQLVPAACRQKPNLSAHCCSYYMQPFRTVGSTLLSGGSFGCTTIFTSIWQNFFCQMGPLLGVDPGLPFGLYFFPLTSEQLSIIYIKCQEHISEQFLFLLLFCFCWHWWSEGPICGTFLQESKSWSKLSPYQRFEGSSKTEIDQGFQKSWSHPR